MLRNEDLFLVWSSEQRESEWGNWKADCYLYIYIYVCVYVCVVYCFFKFVFNLYFYDHLTIAANSYTGFELNLYLC